MTRKFYSGICIYNVIVTFSCVCNAYSLQTGRKKLFILISCNIYPSMTLVASVRKLFHFEDLPEMLKCCKRCQVHMMNTWGGWTLQTLHVQVLIFCLSFINYWFYMHYVCCRVKLYSNGIFNGYIKHTNKYITSFYVSLY